MALFSTNALAFGGIGIGPFQRHKNSGGVDTIGVHIDGKSKAAIKITDGFTEQEPEESCPPEKQCGDYCCQGDNVCKQNPVSGEYQCCSETLDYCCPANEAAYKEGSGRLKCCTGTIYCSLKNSDGNCSYITRDCCSEGQYIACVEYYENSSICRLNMCVDNDFAATCRARNAEGLCLAPDRCPKAKTVYPNLGLNGGDLCCAEENFSCAQYDEDKCILAGCCTNPDKPKAFCSRYNGTSCFQTTCCPADSTGASTYSINGASCCAQGTKSLKDSQGILHCCPEGATDWVDNVGCCAHIEDQNGDTYCCPVGSSVIDGHCCPEGTIGLDNEGKCCEAGNKFIDGICCPENSVGLDEDGYCCTGVILHNDDDYAICCPIGTIGFDMDGNCCEAGNVLVGDEPHCCPEGSIDWDDEAECI